MIELFNKKFNLICRQPEIGIKRADFTYKNVRFFVVKKHYLVVYQINSDSVVILRVLSAYQDICSLL